MLSSWQNTDALAPDLTGQNNLIFPSLNGTSQKSGCAPTSPLTGAKGTVRPEQLAPPLLQEVQRTLG